MFASSLGDGSAFGRSIDYVPRTCRWILPAGSVMRPHRARCRPSDPVAVFNCDILSGHDLSAQIDMHCKTDASVTLHLAEVADPSRFGVVPTDDSGRVTAFLEKTPTPPTNLVNGGCYIFRREIIDQIPAGRRVSVEREVFPALIESGELVMGYHEPAYWLDVGTPQAFVRGSCDLVLGRLPARRCRGRRGLRCCLPVLGGPGRVGVGGTVVGGGARSARERPSSAAFFSTPCQRGRGRCGARFDCRPRCRRSRRRGARRGGDRGRRVDRARQPLARGIRVWPGARLEPTSVRFSSDA